MNDPITHMQASTRPAPVKSGVTSHVVIRRRFDGSVIATMDVAPTSRPVIAVALEALAKATTVEGADLADCDLSGAVLTDAWLNDCIFHRANLTGAKLDCTDVRESSFYGANLARVDFTNACMRVASLAEANAVGAIFRGVDLRDATLSKACLDGADFTGANITQTEFARLSVALQ